MKILSIETSCDETAVSLAEAKGGILSPTFSVLGNALISQINIHKEYGGVFPMLAKREHAKNLIPLLEKVMTEAGIITLSKKSENYSEEKWKEIEKILEREEGLFEAFKKYLENVEKPEIDVIGVTYGPGLAPALWVGISFAKALSLLWNIPLMPINHMEGHIISVLIESRDTRKVEFPALSLLISGGHTELVQIKNWGEYKVLGETKDDAVGEAFDKTARLLGLPYPGGPEVSKLAESARTENIIPVAKFPRPMLHSQNLDFSFSGLKTAVLYYIRDLTKNGEVELSTQDKADISREFEDTVVDVLLHKTKKALEENEVKTLIIAGGVIANKKITEEFLKLEKEFGIEVKIPTKELSTDNSLMIAGATYINSMLKPDYVAINPEIKAVGNLKLGENLK
ncbi:MAG TPA: tRNA (adenosine(37)-N6)-threonylcarbamoyltransferase complex transferase subunit TsaD [Candidatus Paceibacterota bacterium]